MHIRESRSDRITKAVCYVFVGLFALACLLPLLLVLSVSLSSESAVVLHGYSIFPQDFSLDTYKYIFQHSGAKILRSYGVTLFITVVGTLIATTITAMIAYALSIKNLRYRNLITFACNLLGLKDSIWALILPSVFSVWNMFLLRTYFSAISPSLYEAAILDGANYFQIFWRITVPLSKTTLLTVGMMYALAFWNDWWNALMFINSKDLFPLQYYLYNILSNVNAVSSGRIPAGASGIQLPAETVKMAVTMITIGPIIFLYPFVQKYFVNGIMTGAVKE